MSNIQEQSFILTGWEIVPYSPPCNNQEASEHSDSSAPIEAIPLAFHVPKEVGGTVKGNGPKRKRRKGIPTELVSVIERDLTLFEIYKSDNIQEIIRERERGLAIRIDQHQLLQNLKRWKIETRRRSETDGQRRTDKIYWHLATGARLRSRTEIQNFIDENSVM